jgi:proteasome assembly chaperone (PAC2) family protein
MTEKLKLNHPWLVAVWPGMGHVAINAGYYLMSKLGMQLIAEYEAGDLFDIEHVVVKEGMIQPGRLPLSRFFLWTDPNRKHDIVVFLGEAQPPIGKYRFCRTLIQYSRDLGVERVFTFAAMASEMHPEQQCRVFGAVTDKESLEELKRLELEILQDGHIGGLNGVLLGAAAECSLRGVCLLGEMPHIFSRLPFPKASMAILEVFTTIAGIELDFREFAEQARMMEQELGKILTRVEGSLGQQPPTEEEGYSAEPVEEERPSAVETRRIDRLFEHAAKDRSKAFELKQELDRLGLFKDYEDRFLDLFKKSGESS